MLCWRRHHAADSNPQERRGPPTPSSACLRQYLRAKAFFLLLCTERLGLLQPQYVSRLPNYALGGVVTFTLLCFPCLAKHCLVNALLSVLFALFLQASQVI